MILLFSIYEEIDPSKVTELGVGLDFGLFRLPQENDISVTDDLWVALILSQFKPIPFIYPFEMSELF